MDLKLWAPLSCVDQSLLDKVRLAYVFGRHGTQALIITEDDEAWTCSLSNSSCLSRQNDFSTPGGLRKLNALKKKSVTGVSFGLNKPNMKVNNNTNSTPTFMVACTSSGNVIQFGQPGEFRSEQNRVFHISEVWCLPKISEVACGSQHCLALTTTGKVFSWGSNDCGQIGNGDDDGDYVEVPFLIEDELENECVVKISCGFSFSVAVSDNGRVYTWGRDVSENDKVCEFSPTLVLFDDAIRDIVCGFTHVLALSNTWQLYVWGKNDRGQLGLGDNKFRSLPQKNETVGKVVDIAASYLSSTSAVKTANHEVFMWGDCSGNIVREPMKTSYKSLMEVFAYYGAPRVTYKPIICHPQSESVSDTMKRAFEDKETSDLIIKAEDKNIFVHRAILRLRSDYFRTFLEDKWTKDTQKTVEVSQPYNVIYSYLRYLYTGEFEADPELALELLVLADEYQDLSFKEGCERKIQCGIKIDNIGILYPLALKLNATKVQESCLSFASCRTGEVVKTPAFSTWDRDTLMEFILQCEKRKLFKT